MKDMQSFIKHLNYAIVLLDIVKTKSSPQAPACDPKPKHQKKTKFNKNKQKGVHQNHNNFRNKNMTFKKTKSHHKQVSQPQNCCNSKHPGNSHNHCSRAQFQPILEPFKAPNSGFSWSNPSTKKGIQGKQDLPIQDLNYPNLHIQVAPSFRC